MPPLDEACSPTADGDYLETRGVSFDLRVQVGVEEVVGAVPDAAQVFHDIAEVTGSQQGLPDVPFCCPPVRTRPPLRRW